MVLTCTEDPQIMITDTTTCAPLKKKFSAAKKVGSSGLIAYKLEKMVSILSRPNQSETNHL